MHRFSRLAVWWSGLALIWTPALRAEEPPDPLRFLPPQVSYVVTIEQPRKLVEGALRSDIIQQLQTVGPARELLESAQVRRADKMIAYLESLLGLTRMEMLDRLAGGGIVIGGRVDAAQDKLARLKTQEPQLLIIQGTDADLLAKFMPIALNVLQLELVRRGYEKPQKGVYRGVETGRLGSQIHFARAGAALIISNQEAGLRRALDVHLDGPKGRPALPQVAQAAKLLPPGALAWAHLSLEPAHERARLNKKEWFAVPRFKVRDTLFIGSWAELMGRTPYGCAGLYAAADGFALRVRLPRGREGMPAGLAAFSVPPAGRPGARPLLEPRGVVVSVSDYLDVGQFRAHRAELFTPSQLAESRKNDAAQRSLTDPKTLREHPTNFFTRLLAQTTPYQRLVVVHQAEAGYQTKPQQNIPAVGLVVELADPKVLGKQIEESLRAAVPQGSGFQLQTVEETHRGHRLTAFRFPEDVPVKADQHNLRFNFYPCLVTVGSQLVVCSTRELCRELIDLLEKESQARPSKGDATAFRLRLYGDGGADVLGANQDFLLTRMNLAGTLTPEEVAQQFQDFTRWVRRLGVLQFETEYSANDYRWDLRFQVGQSKTP